jgi:hypothetical protein
MGIAIVALSLAASGVATADSKCDAGVTKAAGKKVACKANVIAKSQKTGDPVDNAKLSKCESKFLDKCAKEQARGDCIEQTQPCSAIEAEADACVADISGSPSAAFLD